MSKRDDYPIIRDKSGKQRRKFPLDGERRSQTFVNDPDLEENSRRMRVDPLIDGWDDDEDPVRVGRPRRNDTKIPIR